MISKEEYRKKIEEDIEFCNQYDFEYPPEVMSYLITGGKSYECQKNVKQGKSQREIFDEFQQRMGILTKFNPYFAMGLFIFVFAAIGYVIMF